MPLYPPRVPLGRWVLREACQQVRRWHDAGFNTLGVSVNISAAQLSQSGLQRTIVQSLVDSGLEPAYLELELTESVLMQYIDKSIALLSELRQIGVEVSIDDFGTGYSSLSYLKRLPINTLKIDRSFVRDIISDADDAAIVTATIALAHNLRLKVVAEGVEDTSQLEFLRDHGCDGAQGFLFSRPLPACELPEWLRCRSDLQIANHSNLPSRGGKAIA